MFSQQAPTRHRPSSSEGRSGFLARHVSILKKAEGEDLMTSDELVCGFSEIQQQTLQVAEWHRRAWRDLSEDLKLLIGSPKCPEVQHYQTPDSDSAEGLFAGIRQTISAARSQINSYCFKCRGKYSETECKKGVAGALDKMIGDLWHRLKTYALKPLDARLADTFDAANHLNRVSESMQRSLEEALVAFAINLNRFTASLPQSPKRRHISFVSEVSEDLLLSEARSVDVSVEVREEGNKLLESLQRLSTSPAKDTYTPALRADIESVLGEMESVQKLSQKEADFLHRDLQDQKVDRDLATIKARVSSLCRRMEELSTRLPTSDEVIANLQLENRRLESIVVSQAGEIHQLKESLSGRHEKDAMVSLQSSILAEVLEMKKFLDRGVPIRRKTEDLGPVLAVMRAMTPEIEAASDSGFLEKFCEELEKARNCVSSYLSALEQDGMAAATLNDTIPHILKIKRENESLKTEVEQVLQKYEQMRSELEMEIEYLETRLHTVESQKEDSTKALLAFSEPQSPTSKIEAMNSLDGDSFLLSTDDSSLVNRFEAACKDRARLRAHIADLQSALHLSEEQVFAYRHLYGELPHAPDSTSLFFEFETDEEALSMKTSVALELLKDRAREAAETVSRVIDSVHRLSSLRRKAAKDEIRGVMEGLKRVAGWSMENFVETRRVEGQVERLEVVLKERKLSVHFSEEAK